MFKLNKLTRQTGLKVHRNRSFYIKFIKFIIVFFILVVLFGKMFSVKKLFRRREFVVQKDLLDYNEDDLRKGWPFKITKNYDMYDLRTYISKPKVVSSENSPGEGGDFSGKCLKKITEIEKKRKTLLKKSFIR